MATLGPPVPLVLLEKMVPKVLEETLVPLAELVTLDFKDPQELLERKANLEMTVPLVLMVPQVPRGWLVKGALLVCLVSVVREDSQAFPAHRVSPASRVHLVHLETEVLLVLWGLLA